MNRINLLLSIFRRPTTGENRTEIDLRYTLGGFLILLVWASASACLAVPDAKAVILLWALACLMIGFATGFLFGIPKVEQSAAGAGNVATAPTVQGPGVTSSTQKTPYSQQVNTNLEQISDWLTKIIVGLGLVELKEIPGTLHRFAIVLATSLPSPDSRVGFCTGVIIAFCTLGFLTGYLLTRMFFAGAFSRADRDSLGLAGVIDASERTALERVQLDPRGPAGQNRTLDAKAEDAARKLQPMALDELKTAPEIALWARAQISSGKYDQARRGILRAIDLDDSNPQYHYDLAIAMSYQREDVNAILAELVKAHGLIKPDSAQELRLNIYKSLTFHTLYLPKPQSYQQCIQYGEEYLNKSGNLPSTSIWINLAAAYGQRATDLRDQKADAKELEENREKALFCVKEAVRLDTTNTATTRLVRLLVKAFPGKPPDENDLEVFEDMEDFRRALNLQPLTKSNP